MRTPVKGCEQQTEGEVGGGARTLTHSLTHSHTHSLASVLSPLRSRAHTFIMHARVHTHSLCIHVQEVPDIVCRRGGRDEDHQQGTYFHVLLFEVS